MIRSTVILLTISFAVLFIVGCAKTPEKLYPVNGSVFVGGKPLTGGTVQFEMIEVGSSGKVYTSSGEIDKNGRYQLITFGKPGAPAGEHRVWVTPNPLLMPDKLGVGLDQTSPIPQKYMLPVRTDLSYTVSKRKNSIDVEVPAK